MTRRLLAGFVAIGIAVIAVWYVLLWSPQGQKLTAAEQSVAAAEKTQTELFAQASTLKTQQRYVPALRAALNRIDAALPPSAELAATINGVNTAASSAGVNLQSFSVQAQNATSSSNAPAGLSEVPLNMTVQGTYYQVMNFVYYIQHLPRLVKVTGLDISPGSGTEYSCNITAAVYDRSPSGSNGGAA